MTGGGRTYLDWLMSAWGWTLSVAVAGAGGGAGRWARSMGILRTTPSNVAGARSATPGSSCSATSRCWCRCSSGTSCCPEFMPPLKRWMIRHEPAYAQFVAAVLVPRLLHLGADRRAGARRHPVAAARPAHTPAWRSGLTLPQTYRYVLLPMAFRIVIPPLTSEIDEHHQELVGGARRSGCRS
ncbi:MAG: hypothetical protein MZW92_43770 [Comamonadaceae bacterium]|nr:hypothetical protein [Comamonadaceae bacterium]